MQSVEDHLFRRGKRGTFYVRRRIPSDVLDAFPAGKKEVCRSLRTSDRSVAKARLHVELARLEELYEERRQRLRNRWTPAQSVLQLRSLSDQQMQELVETYERLVLQTDNAQRSRGMDDETFDELGNKLRQQRGELGALLARGRAQTVIPAMRGFMHLMNLDVQLEPDDERRAAYQFLEGVVRTLDKQLLRQDGQPVPTEQVVAPLQSSRSWDEVFACWRDYVVDRPKATTIACLTAWKQLKAFAVSKGVPCPAHVTPALMSELVLKMRHERLAAKTINERVRKIRAVYEVARGHQYLQENPAAHTLGVKIPMHMRGKEKRQPFSASELQTIFGSPIYLQHLRSRGQSGEASYWIPLLMLYTGARPEEIAGLMVCDVQPMEGHGWYIDVTDLPSPEDADLFELGDGNTRSGLKSAKQPEERRHLKNPSSRRPVPMAVELERLGFLRYVAWVKAQGHQRLFPTLIQDTHGKLSGAHSKFFGRLKRSLGITSSRKTLYSLRHNMKDLLEEAGVPSRYLKRILGHTTGDGEVTDGYGSGLPLVLLFEHFRKVQFPAVPALPWEPGKGFLQMAD